MPPQHPVCEARHFHLQTAETAEAHLDKRRVLENPVQWLGLTLPRADPGLGGVLSNLPPSPPDYPLGMVPSKLQAWALLNGLRVKECLPVCQAEPDDCSYSFVLPCFFLCQHLTVHCSLPLPPSKQRFC